jgi:hypothetical protein
MLLRVNTVGKKGVVAKHLAGDGLRHCADQLQPCVVITVVKLFEELATVLANGIGDKVGEDQVREDRADQLVDGLI